MSVYAEPKVDILTAPSEPLPATTTGRKRWTRADCVFMENAGLLKGRYELLDGEVILKVGQNGPHAIVVMRIIAYCLSLFPEKDRVRTQATMEVRDGDRVMNRPEPDVFILHEAMGPVIPQGTDVLLAIEVSDTTQSDDFGIKTRLYARAGVAEYWVLDVPRRILVSFRSPEGDEWQFRTEYTEDDMVAPFTTPDSAIRVADLLP